MIDRWYYTHAGQTLGPVTAAQLRQLAAAGRLDPNDLIWPEGGQQSGGVPAQAAIDFTAPAPPPRGTGVPPAAPSGTSVAPVAPPPANKPDWLDDIRSTASPPSSPPVLGGAKGQTAAAKPDWLEDVRAAEQENQEFLTLEWDGENANTEEEMANQLLDESEAAPDAEAKSRAAAKAPSCRLLIGSATTRGRVRDRNEDSVLVQQCSWSNVDRHHEAALIVVADGMGGHQAGERASALVIRALGKVLAPLLTGALSEQAVPADPSEMLVGGLIEANRLVREMAQRNPAWKGMGSTAVALLIWDGRAYIRLVGDCRVYHWRGGKLTQVTRDQTLVARMVELGQLTPEEAAKHPRRNEVAQAVGKYALIEPASYELSLSPGDWLVACSDGLPAHVSDPMLGETIAKAGPSATELANRLVEMANQGGGSDNCTVVAVRCV
jgi:serine/threonine protein phosphatase PrpC